MSSSRVLQIISEAMPARDDGSTVLGRLCSACAQTLPVSGVGLALMTDGVHGGTVAATDSSAATMEDLQESLGEGPCVDASRDGRPVLQSDLARTGISRWPGFGFAALEAGIAAVFAFPLQVGRIRLGVLDLYRDTAGQLDQKQLTDAFAFADAATAILLHLQDQTPSDQALHPQLTEATAGRQEIHQATGMIAVQASVSLTEALLLLRARAYADERSLLDAARDVVARKLRFSAESGHDE